MREWIVYGADPQTGESLSLIVSAATPSAAEDAAYRRGLLVQRVDIAPATAPAPASPAPPTAPASGVYGGSSPRETVLIEQTSKEWKAGMLIGGVGMALGMLGCVAGEIAGGTMIFWGSALVYVVSRLTAWWRHG